MTKNVTVLAAYHFDENEDSIPLSNDGTLMIFPSVAAGKAAGGRVVGIFTWKQVEEMCRRYDLALPECTDELCRPYDP